MISLSAGVIVLFLVLIICMAIGVPIGISLGAATVVAMVLSSNIKLLTIAQSCFGGLDSFPLMAIPFFILAGNLMKYGGISRRLLNFADAAVGCLTGGIGMVTTLASMFFAAISGSAPATVTAIGSVTIPEMKAKGYDEAYAAALTAASGTIGVIIPPSVPFVIYGVVSGASIGGLFMAGVIPGIIIGIALMAINYYQSKKHAYGTGFDKKFELSKVFASFIDAIWSLLAPIIILGGIYGGVFTPTEAAVVGCVYAILVGKFVYRELNFKDIYEAFKESAIANGATTFMIGLSLAFASYLTMAQVPATVAGWFLSVSNNPYVILILINLFLLFVGCFIDNISSCVILTPILLPIVVSLGMDPIHFGIVMTVNLAIGFITPPYGANLFFASAISNVTVTRIASKIAPFILVMIIILLLLTFVPALSMWLPNMLM